MLKGLNQALFPILGAKILLFLHICKYMGDF